ncbi:sugar ABC transporter permease [Dactylosporangium sp. NPDC000521]|uniref:sugar ABC transporter permease n=1 Tax=Dactylosporangium sp. NPDC000521 TaxID=3363975 RepID=UPI0036BC7BFF
MTVSVAKRTEGQPARLRSRLLAPPSGGDHGFRTVVIGIVGLWILLYALNPRFLTVGNLSNLLLQIAAVTVLSMGAVIVLLLGEIDLSMGSVSGLCAAVMAVVNTKMGVPAPLAVVAAILCGVVIGLLHGVVVTRFAVPSFVVTLGGLLTWQGVQLAVLGEQGNLNITDDFIAGLTATYVPDWLGWTVTLLATAYLLSSAMTQRRNRSGPSGQSAPWYKPLLARTPVAALVLIGGALLISHRGIPLVVLIVLAVATLMNYVLTTRKVGRHLYAIGSNAEAARRTGVRVDRIKVAAFACTAGLAALGGVLAASRLFAVNQSSGQGSLLLLAIAGAVIGGVSLFGGVGTVWQALLGSLLIGSIANGMDLLSMPSSYKFAVTGAVLVLAVIIDATARRRAAR